MAKTFRPILMCFDSYLHVMNSWEKTGDKGHCTVNNMDRNIVVILDQISSILLYSHLNIWEALKFLRAGILAYEWRSNEQVTHKKKTKKKQVTHNY